MSNLSQFHGGLLKYNTGQVLTATNASGGVASNAFHADTVAILIGSATTGNTAHFGIGVDPTVGNGQPLMSLIASSGGSAAGGGAYTGPLGVTAGHVAKCFRQASSNVTVSIIELKY